MGAGDLISLSYKCNRSRDYPQPFRGSATPLGSRLPARLNSALASETSTNVQKSPLFSHLGSLVSLQMAENGWEKYHSKTEAKNFKRIITANG